MRQRKATRSLLSSYQVKNVAILLIIVTTSTITQVVVRADGEKKILKKDQVQQVIVQFSKPLRAPLDVSLNFVFSTR